MKVSLPSSSTSSTLTKTTFTHTVQAPTTPTAADGVVTFTLAHFDPKLMDVGLSHGSSGTIGTYDPQAKTIQVSGLKVR